MRWEQKVQYATLSDIGLRRKNNQDSFTIQFSSDKETFAKLGHLFVVADGMGGHAVGELASKMAVDAIPLTYFKSRAESTGTALIEAIEHANHAIHERGSTNVDFNRMGTTCVCLVLSAHGATLGHVGDSRAYRVRGDRIEQLTFDHSLQWELERQGRLKKNEVLLAEVKHVITRSLGPEPTVDVEIDGPHPVLPNDKYLLCSDGLTGYVTDSEIGMIVRELPLEEAARLLVNLAKMRGGSDNITVIVVQCGDWDTPQADDSLADSPTTLVTPHRGQSRLAIWLGLIILMAVGSWLLTLRMYELGGGLVGIGVLAAMGLLATRKPAHPVEEGLTDTDATVDHRPYRLASARTSKEFLATLTQMELELRKMADEESWQLEWEQHARAVSAARQALDKKLGARALSELGKAVDLLMTGLHAHRKKLKSQAANENNNTTA